jgi:putative spermidine/putrescine transport system substrate-binding protein
VSKQPVCSHRRKYVFVKKLKVVIATGMLASTLAGVALTSGVASASSKWAMCASAASCGGQDALVAAAKAEGSLNVITIPLKGWANYGTIMKDFTKKYGIKINDANPEGSSANEITAIAQGKGRSSAPDVVDVGTSYALNNPKDWSPYKVATWNQIPAAAKDANGNWFDDYGGYVAIGCDTAKVTKCPTSLAQLSDPMYKGEVGINGDPTQASAAFGAVMAAALANGGSYSNIQPGVDFFANLNKIGNYVPGGSPATAVSGATPILIWWDYLNTQITSTLKTWKVVIPTDASYAAYYTQAITYDAPHPAAARLWEEYLYSTEGQNLFLQGQARPIELAAMTKNGTVNKTYLAGLPAAPAGALTLPSLSQLTNAAAVVLKNWATEVSSGSAG